MWLTRTPPFLPAAAGSCRRTVCAIQQQHSVPKLSSSYASFLSWLSARNDDGDLSAVRIGTSQETGRGLFASRPLRAGERVLEISLDLMLAPSDLPDEISTVVPATVKPWTKLALVLLMERCKGESSAWAPYISCLPNPPELDNTILWEDSELLFVKESPLYRNTLERLGMIKAEFEAVQNALSVWPQLFGNVSLGDFKHIYATVFSRALAVGEDSTLVMIPMLDFLNHNTSTFATLSFNGLLNYAVVTADRDYAQGDQIWINYGNLSNAELALDYGFALSENPYDEDYLLTHLRQAKIQEPGVIEKQTRKHEDSILELTQHSWSSGSRQRLAAAVLNGELETLNRIKLGKM